MAEPVAASSAGESWQDRFTAKVGPLAVWQWAAIILVLLLAWMYIGKWGFFGGSSPSAAQQPSAGDSNNLGDYAARGPGGGAGVPYTQSQPLQGGTDYSTGFRDASDSTASPAPLIAAPAGAIYASGTSPTVASASSAAIQAANRAQSSSNNFGNTVQGAVGGILSRFGSGTKA